MKKSLFITAIVLGISSGNAMAQDVLVVDTWGGSFRDLIDERSPRNLPRKRVLK